MCRVDLVKDLSGWGSEERLFSDGKNKVSLYACVSLPSLDCRPSSVCLICVLHIWPCRNLRGVVAGVVSSTGLCLKFCLERRRMDM